VVLLDNIIEILDLSQFDARFMFSVVAFYSRGVGSALVDGVLLRSDALVDGLAQEAAGRFAVTLGSQEEVNGVTCFIDSAIENTSTDL
jgi:hypothetical protein